jgi:TonB family protein
MIREIRERIRLYYRHYPEYSYSIISLILLFVLIGLITFEKSKDNSDYIDVKKFNMVELIIYNQNAVQEINISETEEENLRQIKEEEKDLQFGNPDEFNKAINTGTPPKPEFSSLPEYPDSMREARIEGMVLIELGIDKLGNIKYGKIVKSLGREFDLVVIDWAKGIKFFPALDINNRPMKCKIKMPIRFKLDF